MNKVLLFVMLLTGMIACTKEEKLAPLPQNKILTYKVTNLTDTVIYAGIDNLDNTITVYIPFYYGLNVIDPELTVSPGASLTEEVKPVNIEDTTQVYTVKAANGTTNVYHLKIVQLNPASLTIDWAPSVGSDPVAYPYSMLPDISGNLNSTNISLARVRLVSVKTGASTSINLSDAYIAINPNDGLYSLYGPVIPATIDTGFYKVHVSFLGNESAAASPVHIVHRKPNPSPASRVAKQGETISFTSFEGIFIGLQSVKVMVNSISYDLAVVSYTPLEMTLRIPDNFPVGYYESAEYSYQFDGWPTVVKSGALTINAK